LQRPDRRPGDRARGGGGALHERRHPSRGHRDVSTVAEFMLHRLHSEWGVKRIYGYPGDGISGLMGAFNELGNEPEFIQVRHAVIASYAATAHSKFTGEVGVCIATSGPGAIQLLNGLYDAKLDHRPLLALVGQQKRVSLGSD